MKKVICTALALILLTASLAACDNINTEIANDESFVFQTQEESKDLFEETTSNTFKEAEKDIDNSTCDANPNDTVTALFGKVFSGEERVWFSDGTSRQLGSCYTYYLYVQQHKNRVAYIDFDGNGIVEALVQSESHGEHILHYDFSTKKTYAIFISPRNGYTYFSNGEFGYDTLRYKIQNFDSGNIETISIDYTDITPDSTQPTWYDVEISTYDKG